LENSLLSSKLTGASPRIQTASDFAFKDTER